MGAGKARTSSAKKKSSGILGSLFNF
jgi:hypothetical protein